MSAHSGHGNPCSAHVLETLGADSINPVRDVETINLELIFVFHAILFLKIV